MHGFGSPAFAPMIGTHKLPRAIEQHNFGRLFSPALTTNPGELPEGQWRTALAWRDVLSPGDLSVRDARVVQELHLAQGCRAHARATSPENATG